MSVRRIPIPPLKVVSPRTTSELTVRRFCTEVLGVDAWDKTQPWEDSKRSWGAVTFRNIATFLRWILGQREGEDGRATKGLGSAMSLTVYWCNFRLSYERAMNGRNIDDVVPKRKMRVVSCFLICPGACGLHMVASCKIAQGIRAIQGETP